MKREALGKVEENEKKEFQEILKWGQALNELVVATNSQYLSKEEQIKLKNLVMPDFEIAIQKLNQWWSNVTKKYGWENYPSKYLNIDFTTNEIFVNTHRDDKLCQN